MTRAGLRTYRLHRTDSYGASRALRQAVGALKRMRLEDLAIVGNCQFSALIENTGQVVWCCLPKFDSEPVFSTILDPSNGGLFTVGPADSGRGEQAYMANTNVL